METKQQIVVFLYLHIIITPIVLCQGYHNPSFYPNRTGIVQLFQWPFKYIARECEEFLGPKGYAAVQTSPVHENRITPARLWYEVYQPISYKINNRFGNENEFADMIKRCNAVGVRIFVDIVSNHMSNSNGKSNLIKGTAGSLAAPKIQFYPGVPYTELDFHKQCFINSTSSDKRQFYNCELLGLPDLDQSKPHVRYQLIKMMNHLLDLGVAGFRIDSASFMDPNDLKVIYNKVNNLNTKFNFTVGTRPFIYHDAQKWKNDYTDLGRIIESNYSIFLSHALLSDYALVNDNDFIEKWNMVKSYLAIVDNGNHNSQRSFDQVTHRDPIYFKMITAFMLAYPYGIPKMISSYAFDTLTQGPPMDANENIIDPAPNSTSSEHPCAEDWLCEHRWTGIPEMIEFANVVQGEELKSFWSNNNGQVSFCRGNKGFIAFNSGKNDMSITLNVCLPSGTYCDVVTGHTDGNHCSGKIVKVDQEHKAIIQVNANDEQKFLAIHVDSLIKSNLQQN